MYRALNHVLKFTGGILLLLAVATSCEEPVDLGIGLTKRKLVISSSFFPDAPVTLKVSATRAPGEPYVAIEDAQVTLYEGPELAATLVYRPPGERGKSGDYHSGSFHPLVGKRYTIHVEADHYDPVTAVSSIPDPIAIGKLTIAGLTSTVTHYEATYDYRLAVTYEDPVDATNYYELRVYQEVYPFMVNTKGDTIRNTAYLKSVRAVGSVAEVGTTVSLLLKDGGRVADLELHLQSTIDERKERIGEVVAELRTVSPEYYFYRLSKQGVAPGPSTGLTEPVIIYNNVDQGVGNFAGYNAVQRHLPLFGN